MSVYKVGDVMPLREKGKQVANTQVIRLFSDDNESKMVETQIVELAIDYKGPLKLGAKLSFPEDGYIGTFANP